MEETRELYDVTIIGAGPAGLFSAFYSGLREMKTKVIEYHPYLGGKLNLYPEKMIWDIGGLPPQPAGKVIEHLISQAEFFEPTIIKEEKIISIDREQDYFVLTAESGRSHLSKTVIMATGYGLLKPETLNLAEAEKFAQTNLIYHVQNPQDLKGQRVLISGGGNGAVDWANLLEPLAAEVHLAYRKESLKGHEAEVTKLLRSRVNYLQNHELTHLKGDETAVDKLKYVTLVDTNTGEEQVLEVDVLLVNHGYESEKTIFENNSLGLKQLDDYYLGTSAHNHSEVPGIFAAGDLVQHEGKLHLIAGAFHDACNAVNQAKLFIEPEAYAWGRVSSHNDSFNSANEALVEKYFS